MKVLGKGIPAGPGRYEMLMRSAGARCMGLAEGILGVWLLGWRMAQVLSGLV